MIIYTINFLFFYFIVLNEKMTFIVLEGVDNSGKTTQCDLLFNYFKKKNTNVEKIKFPCFKYNNEIEMEIKKYLHNPKEWLKNNNADIIYDLFFQNRLLELNYINSLIEKKTIIICDRYSISGYVYHIANIMPLNDDNELRKKFIELKEIEKKLPQPDYCFYLTPLQNKKTISHIDRDVKLQKKIKLAYEMYMTFFPNEITVIQNDPQKNNYLIFEEIIKYIIQ